MGKPADGRSYVRIATPPGLNRLTGKKKDANGHDVLLELYDQVATISDKQMINDDAWYEVAMTQKLIEAKNPKLKREAKAREDANKKVAEMIAAENKWSPPHRPPPASRHPPHRHPAPTTTSPRRTPTQPQPVASSQPAAAADRAPLPVARAGLT